MNNILQWLLSKPIDIMVRVLTGETGVQSQVESYQKTQK